MPRMILVNNLKKKFGTNVVLDGVSLSVNAGEIYGLIGHNGAGKTTLMTIMAGLEKADSGECILKGKGISYLPDVPGFYEYLTCGEYIDFLLRGQHISAPKSKIELLDMVGLTEKIRIGSMSRGMRQRLGIAASLVSDPDVLLLDEPTSALDPSGRMEVLEILKDLRYEGKAILLSTHVLADMENICDEVGFLHDGGIKRQIKISDLQDRNAWIISFNDEISLENQSNSFALQRIDGHTYRFLINSSDASRDQNALLKYLITIDRRITSIHNDMQSLDAIFQEVCKS